MSPIPISAELANQRELRVGRISAALDGLIRSSLEPVGYALQQAGGTVVFPDPTNPVARPVYRFLIVARKDDPPMRHLQHADPELGEGCDLHTGERAE